MNTRCLVFLLAFLTAVPSTAEVVQLEFGEATSKHTKAIRRHVIKSGHFQAAVVALNSALDLSETIMVRFDDGEDGMSYYDEEASEIVLEYGHLLDIRELLIEETELDKQSRLQQLLYVSEFYFYHELGHALIDLLELPVAGREEDAADALAAYVILTLLDEPQIAFAAARQFSLEWDAYEQDDSDLYDEHSMDKQRFYNLVAWIYGSDTERHQAAIEELVPDDWWEDRAEDCEAEYDQLRDSWSVLLEDILLAEKQP